MTTSINFTSFDKLLLTSLWCWTCKSMCEMCIDIYVLMRVCWFMLLPMLMEARGGWWCYSSTVSFSSETGILKDLGARLVASMPQ